MTPTRLHPVSLPHNEASDHDRIMSALNKAIEDQKADQELGQCAAGIAIVWYREYEDGTFGESHIIQGLNALEAIGLMKLTGNDLCEQGLGGPDHFPPKEPA